MSLEMESVLALAGSVFFSASLSAATLTVDLNGGADYTDIQAAIDVAKDGDTVLVKPGEYVIAEPINFNRLHDPDDTSSPPVRNIVVKSEVGAEVTTIRGGIGFNNAETNATVLEGFTITGSQNSGVYFDNSSPTLTSCTITGNGAYYGGGVYCAGSSPTLTDCTISGNSAIYGGGVYCDEGSSPTLTNCTISGNSATGFSDCPGYSACLGALGGLGGGLASIFTSGKELTPRPPGPPARYPARMFIRPRSGASDRTTTEFG